MSTEPPQSDAKTIEMLSGLLKNPKHLRDYFQSFGRDGITCPPSVVDTGPRWSEKQIRSAHAAAGKAGLFRLAIAREYGGVGATFTQLVTALEGFGNGCRDVGLGFGCSDQIFSMADCIAQFGNDAQKQFWLPRIASGLVIGSQALTEAEAGSDVMAIATTAVKTADGYVLNGQKTLIGFGSIADFAIVFAQTNPDKGRWGLSAFLVQSDDAGFLPSKPKQGMGLEAAPLSDIEFDNCSIPSDRLLGAEGMGWAIIQRGLQIERALILSSQVGAMARQLTDATAFARKREGARGPVINYDTVASRLADMAVRLETSLAVLYKVAGMADAGKNLASYSAVAKLHISESFHASSLDAVRIYGGRGFLREHDAERDLRDSVGALIYAGTSDVQRQIIAALLD